MEKLNIVKQILKCFKKGILKSTLDHVHKSTHPAFKGRFREKYLGSVRTLSGALKEKGHVALKRGRGEGGGGRHRVFKRKRSGEGITYRQQNIKDCQ